MNSDFYLDTEEEQSFNTRPIYAFPKLKDRLTRIGINIGKAGTWRSVGTVDVLPEDIGERILFENGGIFYIDDEGVKRRGFMYKVRFYFEWQGCIQHPKFHVCKCKAIKDFGRGAYRFANAEPIKIYSRNAHREVNVEGMELCGFCLDELTKEDAKRVKDSTDFVKLLKESGEVKEPAEYDVDIFGYVKNWEEISLAYRTKMEFTCERCGTRINDGFDHFYMQTHHKNGIKTDNREANLECLCIKCHSEVDDVHRRNFSTAASKVMIDEYIHKYHGK